MDRACPKRQTSARVRVLVVEDCRALPDLVAKGLSDQGIAADVAYDRIEALSTVYAPCGPTRTS